MEEARKELQDFRHGALPIPPPAPRTSSKYDFTVPELPSITVAQMQQRDRAREKVSNVKPRYLTSVLTRPEDCGPLPTAPEPITSIIEQLPDKPKPIEEEKMGDEPPLRQRVNFKPPAIEEGDPLAKQDLQSLKKMVMSNVAEKV